MFDCKAAIAYIKQYTGQDKISFMGLSQGSSLMFYALSQDSEWFKHNVNLVCALAPVTRLSRKAFPFYQPLARSSIVMPGLGWLGCAGMYF